MSVEEGPSQAEIQREEGLAKLRDEIDKSKLSDEAKQALQKSISDFPDHPAFDPYIEAAQLGGLLIFEDTNKDGDRRAVMVDEQQKIGHWTLFDLPEPKAGDLPKFVGSTNDAYEDKDRITSGDLTEREVLEVRKSYSEEDPDVPFGEYSQERLDALNRKAEEEGKGLHEN